MSQRRAWLALFSVLAFLIAVPFDADARYMRPRTELRVHEWGVWLFDGGRVTIDDLARESPAFVHRASQQPGPVVPVQPVRPEPVRPQPTRKPVIFFHTPQQLRVQVSVGFNAGTPWLYYPGGAPANVSSYAGLTFTGSVVPNGTATAPNVARGHFWNHLREASDSIFLSDSGESERFIFYDGPSEVAREVTARRNGDSVAVHADIAQTAYLVTQGRYQVLRPTTDTTANLASIARDGAPTRAMERALLDELVLRRLTAQEARALVDTWRHELFEEQRPHLVYLISRVAYEGALPIVITPNPSELVRVGVIIERL
jgi:hypothetical protein